MFHEPNRDNYPLNVKGQLSPYRKGRNSPNVCGMTDFRGALLKALDSTGKTLRSVSTGSGVSYEQLKKLKQNKSGSTNVEDAVKIAAFFGKTVDEFLESPDGTAPHRVTEIYTRLTDEQRQAVLDFAEFVAAGKLSPTP